MTIFIAICVIIAIFFFPITAIFLFLKICDLKNSRRIAEHWRIAWFDLKKRLDELEGI